MRITEIVGKPVVHDSGQSLGVARDVRAVQRNDFGRRDALVVTGIVTGKGSWGVRLGYGSSDQTGPAMLRAIYGRRARHTRYIPWQDLRVEADRIVVTAPIASLRNPQDLEESS